MIRIAMMLALCALIGACGVKPDLGALDPDGQPFPTYPPTEEDTY